MSPGDMAMSPGDMGFWALGYVLGDPAGGLGGFLGEAGAVFGRSWGRFWRFFMTFFGFWDAFDVLDEIFFGEVAFSENHYFLCGF